MIHPDSRSLDWMQQVAFENNFKDITLIEKTIRAFSLLESLVLSGCPFVFKGGTSLMLHLDSARRLSIDIDIICPPGTDIEQYIHKYARDYGFGEVKLVERQNPTNVPKSHAKYFYQVTYFTNTDTENILLDVLFEDIHYNNVVKLPIVSRFLKTEGNVVLVNVPDSADLLGDKLTAFAPNTTGIPYFKGEKSCSMEIIKQLFDVASLFDITNDLTFVADTFRKFAVVELAYRNLNPDNITQVLDDIYQTSLCICLQGAVDADNFRLLQDGIRRIQSFIHSEKYRLDSAIVNASKAAYISTLITNGITEAKHYDPNNIEPLRSATITEPFHPRLNRLKRTNIEAFYYWNEISKLKNLTTLPIKQVLVENRILTHKLSSLMEESLFLNTLAFEFPAETKTFYFSLTDKQDVSLTKLSHQLSPNGIKEIFPNITNGDTLFTSFTRKLDGFLPLKINFATENFALVKRYYNREIKYFFAKKDILVEPTFIKDNQVWLRNPNEKAPKNCAIYDRFTIKVNLNHFTNTPELVLSYDRKAKVYKKSVAAFLSDEENATADLINRVVYVEHFQKIIRKQVTKYQKLNESENNIDYNNVFPIVGRNLAAFLGFDDDEEEPSNPYQRKNRYTKYYSKISDFYTKFLNAKEFRAVILILSNGFDKVKPLQIGKTTPQCKQLVFGKNGSDKNVIDVIPQRGVNNGPYSQPRYNNIQMFFIVPEEQKQLTNELAGYLLRDYKSFFKGLKQYTAVPVSLAPKNFNISFEDKHNPLTEIEVALENKPWNPGVKYLAIYLTPISKHAIDKEQRKIYYRVKEKLLNLNITSQCIETDKMMKVLEEDKVPDKYGKTKNNFAYTLQNIAIAINAKLGGIPWRINVTEQKELIVGVGAFRNTDTNIQYIGSAFSFDNTGAFNSFEYFHHDQTSELAGSIEEAIIRYASVNNKPNRLIIHFYKEMSEEEVKPIENALHNLGLDIPVFVVTINKTESEDFVVFDGGWNELMPYSGRYINLGNKHYLLCNNTRYEDDKFKSIDGFPFPVKLKIECPTDKTQQIDTKTIKELIDQVYQFSRIYWKSVKQQNLPVTIKYPEMVAQIAPHFNGGDIPANIGNDNLWFL